MASSMAESLVSKPGRGARGLELVLPVAVNKVVGPPPLALLAQLQACRSIHGPPSHPQTAIHGALTPTHQSACRLPARGSHLWDSETQVQGFHLPVPCWHGTPAGSHGCHRSIESGLLGQISIPTRPWRFPSLILGLGLEPSRGERLITQPLCPAHSCPARSY